MAASLTERESYESPSFFVVHNMLFFEHGGFRGILERGQVQEWTKHGRFELEHVSDCAVIRHTIPNAIDNMPVFVPPKMRCGVSQGRTRIEPVVDFEFCLKHYGRFYLAITLLRDGQPIAEGPDIVGPAVGPFVTEDLARRWRYGFKGWVNAPVNRQKLDWFSLKIEIQPAPNGPVSPSQRPSRPDILASKVTHSKLFVS